MEYITAAISALEVALFWGMMIIVLLMFLTLLSIVGIGFISVYFLHKLFLLARKPAVVQMSSTVEYRCVPAKIMDQTVTVWYGVANDGGFAGVSRITREDNSRIDIDTLPDIELDTLTEVAFRHSESNYD